MRAPERVMRELLERGLAACGGGIDTWIRLVAWHRNVSGRQVTTVKVRRDASRRSRYNSHLRERRKSVGANQSSIHPGCMSVSRQAH